MPEHLFQSSAHKLNIAYTALLWHRTLRSGEKHVYLAGWHFFSAEEVTCPLEKYPVLKAVSKAQMLPLYLLTILKAAGCPV